MDITKIYQVLSNLSEDNALQWWFTKKSHDVCYQKNKVNLFESKERI